MKRAWSDRVFLAVAPAVLGAWIFACVWFPLTDTDIWWHLAAAKLMWARKAFLRTDPFSLVSLGTPWTDLHWGFQLLAWSIWKSGSAKALVAWKCISLAGAVGLVLWPHWNRRTAFILLPLAAFGCYQIRFYVDVRPLALTLVLLAGQYAALMFHFQGRLRRPEWVVLPLQIALANIQGLFPLGAVLVSGLILGELFSGQVRIGAARNRLLILGGLVWMAGWVNPYGWAGFKLPLELFARITPMPGNIFSAEIAENRPFLDLARQSPGAAIPFACFLLAVILTCNLSRLRSACGPLLVFAAFTILGIMAVRNLPLAFLAGLMAAGRNLHDTFGASGADEGGMMGISNPMGPRGYPMGYRRWGGLAAFLAVVLVYGPELRRAWDYELPGSMETPFRFPTRGADFLAAHPIPGHLFNELRYGGYVEFRLFPEEQAFVDGRMILRSAAFYRDFLAAVDHPEAFGPYREWYGITHALLPISEDRRYLPLAAHLMREDKWDLLQCDGAGVVLSAPGTAVTLALPLDSLPHLHPIRVEVRARFHANPRLELLAARNVAELLSLAGRERAARDMLSQDPEIDTLNK